MPVGLEDSHGLLFALPWTPDADVPGVLFGAFERVMGINLLKNKRAASCDPVTDLQRLGLCKGQPGRPFRYPRDRYISAIRHHLLLAAILACLLGGCTIPASPSPYYYCVEVTLSLRDGGKVSALECIPRERRVPWDPKRPQGPEVFG